MSFPDVRLCTATSSSHLIATMPSNTRKLKSIQSRVFDAVNGNPELLDLLEISTTAARKSIFIAAFLKFLPTAFDRLDKKPDDPFSLFTTWFGGYANSKSLYSCIYAALQHRQ